MYMDWQEEYKGKLVSAEEAVATIKSGEYVHIPLTEPPDLLINTLAARKDEVRNVHIDVSAPAAQMPWFNPGYEDSFPVTIFNYALLARPALRENRLEYIPGGFSTVRLTWDEQERPKDEVRPMDVLLVRVTGPNEHGFFSFGFSLWYKQSCARYARRIIAEIDNNMPWCYGDTFIHISRIEALVENTPTLLTKEEVESNLAKMEPAKQEKLRPIIGKMGPRLRTRVLPLIEPLPLELIDLIPRYLGLQEPGEAVRTIAGHLSMLIKDGDTFQCGVGTPSLYMPQLGVFDSKLDLGYHSEMAARGIARLVDRGVITGKYKTLHPGKAVASTWEGCDEDDLAIINNNPKFELYDSSYVANIVTVSQNDNMVAINNALSIDLTGQINSETVFGPVIVNGSGGQPETHIGALFAKGGRGIHLLRSTAMGGTVSNIVPQFEPGTAVTIPRYWADYVITEYGIARLMGKTFRQRAEELIAIAHPDFRAELRKQAQKLFYPS